MLSHIGRQRMHEDADRRRDAKHGVPRRQTASQSSAAKHTQQRCQRREILLGNADHGAIGQAPTRSRDWAARPDRQLQEVRRDASALPELAAGCRPSAQRDAARRFRERRTVAASRDCR